MEIYSYTRKDSSTEHFLSGLSANKTLANELQEETIIKLSNFQLKLKLNLAYHENNHITWI